MTNLPRNVIEFKDRKSSASKSRVGQMASEQIRSLSRLDCQREEESEAERQKSAALKELEFAILKTYALFGEAALTWVQTVHAHIAVSRQPVPASDKEAFDRLKASHGRQIIENGHKMICESETKDRANWFLETILLRK